MTFKTEVCSVAKTSKISLPHHISLTKNDLSKRKETISSCLVPKGKDRGQTHTILEFQICGPLRSNTRYLYFPIF
jgi:hypothetical protein